MPPRHQIDRLPSDVRQTIKRWLGDENRSVDDFTTFLAELLAPHEISVSRSSAHRFMVNHERTASRLRQSREMTEALARELPDAAMQGKQGRLLVEMARTFVFDLLAQVDQEGGVLDPKAIANIGKGLAELARAARLDQDFETKVEEARRNEREASADKAEAAAKAQGLSAETVKGIRHAILGIAA
ncbi:MAG: hypothetical protein TEF_00315 [Rhizobiales bacterium NRL2]|jgi:hypothetical protein|nr:MAG: hypothetical protein TEF_00315 [Rhizobiales bacterium NRL2]